MDVDLFDRDSLATPRPAWHVIEAARRRYLTGLLVLDTTPVTNVYLRDGQVYFAERSTDGGLGVRLLVEGVITREQMHRATLMVGGVEHLGRMFDRDATIDRDAVELCVELMTDDVLTAIAEAPVTGYRLHLYKRHPSGLDRWLPTRIEVVTHLVSDPALLDDGTHVTPGDGPRSRPHLTPPPASGEVRIPAPAQPAIVEPVAPPPPQPSPVAEVVPVFEAASPVEQSPVVPAPEPPPDVAATSTVPTFAPVPPASFTTMQVPQTPAVEPAVAVVSELLPGSIAGEVADAVRRALAAIDTP